MPLPRPWLPTDLFREIDAADFENQSSNDLWSFSFGHQADQDIANLAKSAQLPEAPIVVSDRPDARRMPAAGTPVSMPTAGAGSAPSSASAAGSTTTPTPSPSPASMPQASTDTGDLEAWARQEAARLGIDPDTAVRVANTEGGFSDPTRQNQQGAPAYGPYQLYIGGPETPGLGDAALQAGIDPRNPAHARAAITFALEHAARNGWRAFQGAAANGIGDFDGIGGRPATAPQPAATQAPLAAQNGAGKWGEYDIDTLTPNQLTDSGLDSESALAACGPAAAIAFARANGRNPTWQEAIQLAQATGWNKDAGMSRGTSGEIALLGKLGVKAQSTGIDEQQIARTVQSGMPVILNAHGNGGHFYVATAVRQGPNGLEFNFGNSAAVLRRSGGKTWWRLDELPSLGVGTPSEAIVMGTN